MLRLLVVIGVVSLFGPLRIISTSDADSIDVGGIPSFITEIESGQVLVGHPGGLTEVAWNHKGQLAMAGEIVLPSGTVPSAAIEYDDGEMAVADSAANEVLIVVPGENGASEIKQRAQVGDEPSAIESLYLNSDSSLDLAVANRGSNFPSVLIGRPDGTLAPERRVSVGEGPAALGFTDVPGRYESHDAIVVANSGSNTVSILDSDGHGRLIRRPPVPVGAGPVALLVTYAFVGRDLATRIVTANATDGTLSSFDLDDAAPQAIRRPHTIGLPGGLAARPVALADGTLSHDDDDDVAVADAATGAITVLENRSRGLVVTEVRRVGGQPMGVVIADVAGDLLPDIVFADAAAGTVAVSVTAGDALLADADAPAFVAARADRIVWSHTGPAGFGLAQRRGGVVEELPVPASRSGDARSRIASADARRAGAASGCHGTGPRRDESRPTRASATFAATAPRGPEAESETASPSRPRTNSAAVRARSSWRRPCHARTASPAQDSAHSTTGGRSTGPRNTRSITMRMSTSFAYE